MGNLCCSKSEAPVPTQHTENEEEPPLAMDLPAITDKLLNEKGAEVTSLIDQATALIEETKSLREKLQTGKDKAGGVMDKVGVKVDVYRGKEALGKLGEEYPLHTMEYFRQKRTEIEELIHVLVAVRHSTILCYIPTLSSIAERTGLLESSQSSISSLLTRARAASKIPKTLSLKASKIEENLKKLVETLTELQGGIKGVRDLIEEAQKGLNSLPSILQEMKTFIEIDPKASELGEIHIEEVAILETEGEFVVEEGKYDGNVWEEIDLGTEVPEVNITDIFDFGDELKEMVRANAVQKAYDKCSSEHGERWEKQIEMDVYRTLDSLIQSESKAFVASIYHPLPTDLYFLHYFLSTFPRRPIPAMLSFLEGFKSSLERKQPFTQLFANWLGAFTATPLPRVVATLLPLLDSSLSQAMEEGAIRRGLNSEVIQMTVKEKMEFEINRGYIHVGDVANLVYSRLNDWPKYVGRTMERLRPAHIKEMDFLHFIIVHRMKSLDMDAITFYKSISDSAGRLNPQRFVTGMQSAMKMYLSAPALRRVYETIKMPEKKLVHRVDFIRFVRLWGFQKQENGMEMMVGRNAALEVIIETYCDMRKDLMLTIYTDFHKNADRADRIRLDQLESTIRLLGETRELTSIFQVCKKDKLTFQDFIGLLERFGVEPYKSRFFHINMATLQVLCSFPDGKVPNHLSLSEYLQSTLSWYPFTIVLHNASHLQDAAHSFLGDNRVLGNLPEAVTPASMLASQLPTNYFVLCSWEEFAPILALLQQPDDSFVLITNQGAPSAYSLTQYEQCCKDNGKEAYKPKVSYPDPMASRIPRPEPECDNTAASPIPQQLITFKLEKPSANPMVIPTWKVPCSPMEVDPPPEEEKCSSPIAPTYIPANVPGKKPNAYDIPRYIQQNSTKVSEKLKSLESALVSGLSQVQPVTIPPPGLDPFSLSTVISTSIGQLADGKMRDLSQEANLHVSTVVNSAAECAQLVSACEQQCTGMLGNMQTIVTQATQELTGLMQTLAEAKTGAGMQAIAGEIQRVGESEAQTRATVDSIEIPVKHPLQAFAERTSDGEWVLLVRWKTWALGSPVFVVSLEVSEGTIAPNRAVLGTEMEMIPIRCSVQPTNVIIMDDHNRVLTKNFVRVGESNPCDFIFPLTQFLLEQEVVQLLYQQRGQVLTNEITDIKAIVEANSTMPANAILPMVLKLRSS